MKKIILFIFLTYLVFYFTSSIFFLKSGQSVRVQIVSFAIVINPLYLISMISITFLFLIGFLSSFLEKRIVNSKISKENNWKIIGALIITSLIFIIFILSYSKLSLENEILKNYPKDKSFLTKIDPYLESKLVSTKINTSGFNVIFILLESVSARRLSSYGSERNVTPNMDYIVNNGIKFENMYSVSTHSDYAQPGYLSSNYVLSNNVRNFFLEQENQNSVWQIFNLENYDTSYFSSQDDNWARINKYFNYDSLDIYWHSETDGIYDYGGGELEERL